MEVPRVYSSLVILLKLLFLVMLLFFAFVVILYVVTVDERFQEVEDASGGSGTDNKNNAADRSARISNKQR